MYPSGVAGTPLTFNSVIVGYEPHMGLMGRVVSAYRRSGADLPGGDPRPSHGAEMEGWFWRLTDTARERVVIALCGINRHPDGDWATVAVAAHPGGVVRSGAIDGAHASTESLRVTVPTVLEADERHLCIDLDDVHLDVELEGLVPWPLRLGAGGLLSAVPFLGQYWHPHVLGGQARGALTVGDDSWPLAGADVYAEKNWGRGFPDWWWWGQAQGFADPTVCVAFGGGRLTAGPVGASVTGCVLRWRDRVIRFAPPAALVRARVTDGAWNVAARKPGWRLLIEADGAGNEPAVLPVPLPAQRRNVERDFEHLAAHMRLRVWNRGLPVLDEESPWAALEVGSTDAQLARDLLASSQGLAEGVPPGQRARPEGHPR